MEAEKAKKRILFVDDELGILDGLRNALRSERRRWDMSFAQSGQAALDQLALNPFDIVVSDMRMPHMDGAAFLKQVQLDHPDVARIVLSGHADLSAILRAVPVAHQYLTKPCDASTLRATLDRVCSLRDLLSNETIRVIIGGTEKLPSLPRPYADLTTAMQNPDASIKDMAKIIERDMTMSARVLQFVNSSFFGLGQKMTNIEGAVVYLGVNVLRHLVLSISIFGTFGKDAASAGLVLDNLQTHALLMNRIVKRIMKNDPRVDFAQAAAMLHDIGELIIAAKLPDRYAMIVATAKQRKVHASTIEEEMLGFTHAQAGAYLLGLWGLPYPVVEAVAYHHCHDRVRLSKMDPLGAVYIAEMLTDELTPPGSPSADPFEQLDEVSKEILHQHLAEWRIIAQEEAQAVGALS